MSYDREAYMRRQDADHDLLAMRTHKPPVRTNIPAPPASPRKQIEDVLAKAGASPEWIAHVIRDLCNVLDAVETRGFYRGIGKPVPPPIDTDKIPWNQPGSTQQSLGAALAEHGTGGDTYD